MDEDSNDFPEETQFKLTLRLGFQIDYSLYAEMQRTGRLPNCKILDSSTLDLSHLG